MTDPHTIVLKRQRPLLGTFVEIGVADAGPTRDAQAAITAAFDRVAEVHSRLSFQDKASTLSRLNATPGTWVPIDPMSRAVLRLAKAMTAASGGLFNCTVGGALVSKSILPDHGGPKPLAIGRADDIDIASDKARLKRPVRLTLDGIAKGYAVDLAVRALMNKGIAAGWVNAGGDMRAFGGARPLIHRREMDGTLTPLGRLGDGAMATSARRATPDARYPGWLAGGSDPAPDSVWTVLSNSAWRADALTKVAALAPPAERASMVARLGGHIVVSGARMAA